MLRLIPRVKGLTWSLVLAATICGAPLSAIAQRGATEYEGRAGEVGGTCPAVVFTVNGTTIATDGDTEFDDGTCADLREGTLIEVEGELQADGRVVASEVEFESESDDDDDDDDDDDGDHLRQEDDDAPPDPSA